MNLRQDDALYIDTQEALTDFCSRLQGKSWLAVDTEFLREKTYKPQLCLLQIASDTDIACIDPLQLEDLSPILDILFDRSITKVFHAAGQDLEIFYWLRHSVPGPVFDTQIAAPLLGHAEQIGYGKLVKDELGDDLPKSHSRADWTRRPLPRAQLNYAVDDVLYLSRLYLQMQQKLAELGRLPWLDETFNSLEEATLYDKPPQDMWLRIKGIYRYKGKTLSAIQKLAAWREITAKKADIPRNWLLKDDLIADLAKQLPENESELKHIRGLSDSLIRRHGKHLLNLLREAESEKPREMPPFAEKLRLSAEEDAMVDLLAALVKLQSAKINISAATLAPRKELEKLVRIPSESALLSGWRKASIGEQLQDFLNGNMSVSISNGRLRIQS